MRNDQSKNLQRFHKITPGTVGANQATVVDSNKDLSGIRNLTITGNLVSGSNTISNAELAVLDGVTAGTVTASKAVVVDSNKDIGTFRNATINGQLLFDVGGSINADSGTATATGTGTSASATLNKMAGKVTTTSMSAAAGSSYALTISNSLITSSDLVFANMTTASAGSPVLTDILTGSGSVTITIKNLHASTALNSSAVVTFLVIKA